MHRICSTFVTNTEFPLFVIHRIRHQRPSNARSDSGSYCTDQLAENKQRQTGSVRSDRQYQHQDIGKHADQRANRDRFLFTKAADNLSDKRSIQDKSYIRDHTNQTGDLCILEICLEHDLQRCLCPVHTDKLSNRSKCRTYCRTVAQEVSDRLDNIKLLSFLTYFDLTLHTNLCIPDHKLERNKSDHTHDQSDKEDSVAHQVVACVVDQDRQKNLAGYASKHRTDRSCGRQLCTFGRISCDQRQQRTIRNVCDRVECIPQDITCYEQNILHHSRSALPRNKT